MKAFQHDDLELLEYFAHLYRTRGDEATAQDYERRVLEISPRRYFDNSKSFAKTKFFSEYKPLYQRNEITGEPEFIGFGKLLEMKQISEVGIEIWEAEFPTLTGTETKSIEIVIPDQLSDNDRIERRRERRKARREKRKALRLLQQENR